MQTLSELFLEKETDKDLNGFGPFYDALFESIRLDVHAVLEIGVNFGGSIECWLEYFDLADVYGVDIRPSGFTHERYTEINCDAKDLTINDIGDSGLSIVIDDGSHINRDVIEAFNILWPYVNPGGYYVVEDIQVPHVEREYPIVEHYFKSIAIFEKAEFVMPATNILWLRKPRGIIRDSVLTDRPFPDEKGV